jgi:hypothetical protein
MNQKLTWKYNRIRKRMRCVRDGITVTIYRMASGEYRLVWQTNEEAAQNDEYPAYEWDYRKLSSAKQAAWLRFFG